MAPSNDTSSYSQYVLIGSVLGIILSFFIGIAIGRANCIHRKRNFILNLFKSFSECTYKNPCSCCEDVKVHFLPDSKLPCRSYVNKIKGEGFQTCGYLPGGHKLRTDRNAKVCEKLHGFPGERSALLEIMSTMRRARKSIDICVYLFTLWDIQEILVALREKRGIKVRMITDSTDNEDLKRSNQANILKISGIDIKTNSAAKMHNKFVIVDKQIAILGSTNWTLSAFNSNDEALIRTRQPVIVKAFQDKFNSMWNKMSEYHGQQDVRINIDNNQHLLPSSSHSSR